MIRRQHRELLIAAVLLVLSASVCVYGFIKIVPLALAHPTTH